MSLDSYKQKLCIGFPFAKPRFYFSSRKYIDSLDDLYVPRSKFAFLAVSFLKSRLFKKAFFVFFVRKSKFPLGVVESAGYVVIKGGNPFRLKYIACIYNEDNEKIFQKFSENNSQGAQDLIRESRILHQVNNGFFLSNIKTPSVIKCEVTKEWTSLLLCPLYENSCHRNSLNEASIDSVFAFNRLLITHYSIEVPIEKSIVYRIFEICANQGVRLKHLNVFLKKKGEIVRIAFSHGDFTPWNIKFSNAGDFYLLDFETARFRAPIFYDVVHFWYSQFVLIEQKKRSELDEGLRDLISLVDRNDEDSMTLAIVFYFCLRFLRSEIKINVLEDVLQTISMQK